MSKTILAGSTKSWTKLAACGAALVLAAACASDGAGGGGYGDEARAGHHHHGGGPRHRMQPESFTAFAVNLGTAAPGPAPGQSSIVQITIDRWSTPRQRETLLTAMNSGNEQTLLDALQKARVVGTIRTPDTLAWDLRYAHEIVDPDGGRRIILATDRIVHFWEETFQTRSSRYPFMLIELHLDKDGNGEGRMSTASRIAAKDGHLELENYTSEPVMLEKVHAEK